MGVALNEEIELKKHLIWEVHGSRMHGAGLGWTDDWACPVNAECQDKERVIGRGDLTTEKYVRSKQNWNKHSVRTGEDTRKRYGYIV